MRIIVMSDSHGKYSAVEEIVQRNLSADMFIHLGDGERDVNSILMKYPEINIHHVSGNCDWGSLSPDMLNVGLEYGHSLIAVHGHKQYVKSSLDILKKTAIEKKADIVLYGHTHVRYNKYEDGLYIINPGSASCPNDSTQPSYAYVDVTEKGVIANIVALK